MIEIIPAIIPKSLDDLKSKMARVNGVVPMVQIDVLDGKFTRVPSWPYDSNSSRLEFSQFSTEKNGFPFWQSLDFEVDLMVLEPENIWRDWISAGAKRIIIHKKSISNLNKIIEDFREQSLDSKSIFYTELGIALQIEDNFDEIQGLLEKIDFIQLMGIDRIGFQGEIFNEKVLEKAKQIKQNFPNIPLSIDGGINFENIAKVVESGVSRAVVGSTIFKYPDAKEAVDKLMSI